MRREGTPVYMAFDLMWIGGQDLRPLKLMERKQLLRALTKDKGWIKSVEYVERDGKKFMDQIVAAGHEGMVAKKKNDTYSQSTRWEKVLNSDIMAQRRARSKLFNMFRNR